MNSKGFELTIGVLVLLVLGVVLLVGLAYVLSNGFAGFTRTTTPFFESSEAAAIRGACRLSCESGDLIGFCCRVYQLQNLNVSCSDEDVSGDCSLSCSAVTCIERPISYLG